MEKALQAREEGAVYRELPKFNENSYAHFVSTRTYNSRPYFKDERFCKILLEVLEFYSQNYGFTLVGYVIMPDHLHLLLWWDKEERPGLTISKIMQGIKGVTARRIIDLIQGRGLEHLLQSSHRSTESKSHRQNLKYRLWQPGFYDFNIYTEEELLGKINYIHSNPVKAGLALSPSDYKWSSYGTIFQQILKRRIHDQNL